MINNFIFLLRFFHEELIFLKNFYITSAFSQSKNEIVIELFQNNRSLYIIFNVSPNYPFLFLKKDFRKKRTNIANFFVDILPCSIKDILIAEKERTFKISTDKGTFYIILKGAYSNLIYLNNQNKLLSFKKFDDDKTKDLFDFIQKLNFISEFSFDIEEIKTIDFNSVQFNDLKKFFPFFTKDLFELFLRYKSNESSSDSTSVILNFFEKILNDKLFLILDNLNFKILIDINCESYGSEFEIYKFDRINDAIISFIKFKNYFEEFYRIKKNVLNVIENNLEKISNKINQILAKLNTPSKESLYFKYGNLILINASKIPKGSDSFIAEDYETGEKLLIQLDKNASLGENANKYFEKSKKEKKERERLSELLTTLKIKRKKLIIAIKKLQNSSNLLETKKIMTELNLSSNENEKQSQKKEKNFNFRKFLIDNEYEVYIGKNDKNNDELTFKFAKPNDYWFHARGCPGSHVVLKVRNNNEIIPKNIIESAAQLAAYFSKAKNSKLAPVSYTQKKYVIKRKGMPAGQVSIAKEKTILVEPTIPNNCVQIKEDDL